MILGLGLVFAMIFDPKTVQATEQVQKAKEIGETEEDQSGDPLP